MRKYIKFEKKKTIVWLCLLFALSLGVGYAILSEQLNINGSVNYGSIAWDVGFISAEEGGGTISSSPTLSQDKKSVSVSCNVGTSTKSETCIAKAKIKNASSFAVQLESNPTISFDNSYIESVDVVWTEDNSNVVALNTINVGLEKEIKITITTKELTEDMLPETSLNIPIDVTMNWVEFNGEQEPTYVENQIFYDIDKSFTNISGSTTANNSAGPFVYNNSNLFAGKTITKIGIPVKSVSALDGNQTFTLYVVDKNKLPAGEITTVNATYELKLPLNQLGSSTTVNKWVYVDLTDYNITLNENETLAFASSSDTVQWGYQSPTVTNLYVGQQLEFTTRVLSTPHIATGENIFFDIYYKDLAPEHYSEEPVFPNILTDFTLDELAEAPGINLATSPFVYNDLDLFSGKTITRIGIPVKSVTAIDENQVLTLYVVNKDKLAAGTATAATYSYKIKLPVDQLGNSTTVNKWVYVDLTDYNITVGDNETLAFTNPNDTVKYGYQHPNVSHLYAGPQYEFTAKSFSTPVVLTGENIFFDIYVRDVGTSDTTLTLSNVLNGKNLSILGDSISTYTGYSNDTNTNSTIGSNAVYYKGTNILNNVKYTWWSRTLDSTGMNLLVNNAYSGDTVANAKTTRSVQLHDDTGDNAGTNPDIIAIYIGINDIKNGGTLSAFETDYNTMLTNVRNKYVDADIFVFTHLPFYYNSTVTSLEDSELEKFNDVIRNAASNTENCYVVDLFADSGINSSNFKTYMGDVGLHPNASGMVKISDTFINKLEEVYLN